MDPLTLDLIATVAATLAVFAAGGLAIWILPWSEEAWRGRAPASRAAPAPRVRERAAPRLADAPVR